MSIRQPRFAFLALEEHPYARQMLHELLARGFRPEVVVQERSELARVEGEKFTQRIGGRPIAAPILEQLGAQPGAEWIETLFVPRHTSKRLVPLLEGRDLDLVVLGGTRVIRGALLELPHDGVVNAHPGLLPECRGSASPAWSVLHDIPVGATVHLCDSSIDTGDLLLRRELPVHRGDIYEDLCHGTLCLAGRLMGEALEAWGEGRWAELRRPQGESPWPTFKNAPEPVLERVRAKLAAGEYAHYLDGSS